MSFRIVEKNNRIKIVSKNKMNYWKRPMSKLVKDKVIMDLKNAKKLLKKRGDLTVYTVYDLWVFDKKYMKLYEKTGIKSSITVLKHGVFSTGKNGELFLTYGHIHAKRRGELYTVLKNSCYMIITHKKTLNSYLIDMKEGESFIIHPDYIHRLIAKNKDCAVIGFVPEDAGHDYKIVKGRGFPYHLFLTNGWYELKENKKFKVHKIKEIKSKKIRIGEKKLKDVLFNPDKHKKFYKI